LDATPALEIKRHMIILHKYLIAPMMHFVRNI